MLFFSFVATLVIGFAIQRTMGFRLDADDEVEGIDGVEHAESAYDFTTSGGAGRTRTGSDPLPTTQSKAEARGVNA